MLSEKFKKPSQCIIGGCIEVRKSGDNVEIKNCEGEILKCELEP